jgi:hypothetical protein
MILKFHLVNTGGRPLKLDFLNKPIMLSRKGERASSAVVGLDEWKFKYIGAAQKILQPFISAGLEIQIETDLGMWEAAAPTVTTTAAVTQVIEKPEYRPNVARTINEGRPRITTLGQIDLSGEGTRTIGTKAGRGDRAFASQTFNVPMGEDGQQKFQRLPGASGSIQPEPARGIIPGAPPAITQGAPMFMDPAAVMRTQAEIAARVKIAAESAAMAQEPVEATAEAAPAVTAESTQAPTGSTAPIPPPTIDSRTTVPSKRPVGRPKTKVPTTVTL